MTRPRPAEPCSCGCTYDRFTTGLTFWRELKLQLWATHVSECTPPPPVPF